MSNCACKTDGWTVSEPCGLHVGFAKEYAAALTAELAALRADAERYRWLRDGNSNSSVHFNRDAAEIAEGMAGSAWDAAIDAARGTT